MYKAASTLLILAAVAVSGASHVHAQTLEGIPIVSPNPGDRGAFGISVAGVPDTDGDSGGDLLIGAHNEDGGATEAGRAYLLKGSDATVLRTLVSPNPVARGVFGTSVAGVPDVDGDGRADLLVGAPGESAGVDRSGRAYLFSGATGALLRTLTSANAVLSGRFGASVSGVPDANGDGRGDLLIGASGEVSGPEDSGRAYLFSGATGELLHSFSSPNAVRSGFFGTSVSGVPDADGDGRGDLLIGAEVENGGAEGGGRAYLYSGATGGLLQSLVSPDPFAYSQFGNSVSGVPDADGDGRGDLLIGAVTAGADFAGRVHLFSGATGALVFSLSASGSSNFGRSVSGVPDIDGDGRGDLLVGASLSNRAYLYNGATGALLSTVSSGQFGQFGHAVAGVPDTDGDGGGDLLVGAFAEQVGATTTDGRAYFFRTAVLVDTEASADASGVTLSAAPNPASGAATVTVTLGAPEAVTVAVFDDLGRDVARLYDGPLAAGTHLLALDTRGLPSGVYIVRASTPEAVVTQMLTVVR